MLKNELPPFVSPRWMALRLLEGDQGVLRLINNGHELKAESAEIIRIQREKLARAGIDAERLKDIIALCVAEKADKTAKESVSYVKADYNRRDRKLDKILTGKWTGIPFMLALLAAIFYITITGANYPSQLLADGLFWIQDLPEECVRLYLHEIQLG